MYRKPSNSARVDIHFSLLILLSILSGLFALTSSVVLRADVLAESEWQHRPLLLFAPDINEPLLKKTLKQIKLKQCELEDRDMIIGVLLATGKSQLADQMITHQQADQLRDRFTVPEGSFASILIGKDGTVKDYSESVPDLRELFTLIDGMPMRQSEVRQRPRHCQ